MVDKFNSNFYRDWMQENFRRLQNVNIFGCVYVTKPTSEKMIKFEIIKQEDGNEFLSIIDTIKKCNIGFSLNTVLTNMDWVHCLNSAFHQLDNMK